MRIGFTSIPITADLKDLLMGFAKRVRIKSIFTAEVDYLRKFYFIHSSWHLAELLLLKFVLCYLPQN